MPVSARILVLSAMLLVATCGQKGPLYLPEDNALGQATTGILSSRAGAATE